MKVAIVYGTRPEIIKIDPVIKELEKRDIDTILVHTGQHNLESLSRDLGIRKPDYTLHLPPESAGKFKGNLIKGLFRAFWWSLVVIKQVRSILKKEKPDVLFYQGDTLAIASASLAGRLFMKRPKLGHIEAGLRTEDIFNPFPEEIARRIADKTSDLLYAPTSVSAANLKRDRLARGKVIVTGNTIVDAVQQHMKIAEKRRVSLPKKYAVVFVHRQENVHSRENLLELYETLSGTRETIIFIEHPTVIQKLEDFGLMEKFRSLKNLKFQPFYDYIPFLKVLSRAEYVITDSGGIQEEVCSLRVPCLVWRTKTERPEAIKAGAAVLLKCRKDAALKRISEIKRKTGFYRNVKTCRNPYGDGRAAKRIIDSIL